MRFWEPVLAEVAKVRYPQIGNTFLTLPCNHGDLFSFKFLPLRFNAIFRCHPVLTNVHVVPDTIREPWHDKDWLKQQLYDCIRDE